MTVNIDAYDERLSLVGSEDRAAVLLEIVRECDPEHGRALLAHWFNICDALQPWAVELRAEFRRVGFVTDDETVTQPFQRFTVWRGAWHDDPEETALSWTRKRETAEFFCRYLTGPRAWFLGIRREDSIPCVWKATCVEALGIITGREEDEVIVGRLERREIVSGLMTSEQAEEYKRTGVEPWHAL